MPPDFSARATLSAIVEAGNASLVRLDSTLQSLAPGLQAPQPEYRDLATAAYTLHNIYNALENIFEHTSRTFENHITESSRWHKELLDKMFLQIPQIRPAILPPETRKVMNELRGFRHVFRHSYDFDIDPPVSGL